MDHPAYLDNAATTPLDERVLAAMLPHLGGRRGNPSSLHAAGADARDAIEEARESVADMVSASPNEIIFTSGGTEADNLALFGLARSAPPEKRHAVVSKVEHAVVGEAAKHLETNGFEITWLGVDEHGMVDASEVEDSLRYDTALAAVMWANNEVGTIQPIKNLAEICANHNVPFHSDAVQAAGRETINVDETPVSTLALSAHKIYGPQGAGALYIREGVEVSPVLFGGGQEGGLRNGTENAAAIVGFGEAARLAREVMDGRVRHEAELRDRIIAEATEIPGVRLNGHPERRLSNNVHLTVAGVEAESLVLMLDALGYAVGKGSACSSSGHKASPVLVAMGQSEGEAFSALRVSTGKDNTPEEVEGFLEAFSECVERLRQLSPLRMG